MSRTSSKIKNASSRSVNILSARSSFSCPDKQGHAQRKQHWNHRQIFDFTGVEHKQAEYKADNTADQRGAAAVIRGIAGILAANT